MPAIGVGPEARDLCIPGAALRASTGVQLTMEAVAKDWASEKVKWSGSHVHVCGAEESQAALDVCATVCASSWSGAVSLGAHMSRCQQLEGQGSRSGYWAE